MNISPLTSIGIMLGGGAAIALVSKAAFDGAASYEQQHPTGFPASDVMLGASLLTVGVAAMTGAVIRTGALGGIGTLGYALAGATAIGVLGGMAFRNPA